MSQDEHDEVLAQAIEAGQSGARIEALMRLDAESLILSDFNSLAALENDPDIEVREKFAGSLWRFGPVSQEVFIRLLKPDPADVRFSVPAAAAFGLKMIGDRRCLAALSVAVQEPARDKSWRSYFREAAKLALLSIEARSGISHLGKRRLGIWEELPTEANRSKEPIASYWRLAYAEELRGVRFRRAYSEAPDVWSRKQLLFAAYEQETDFSDLESVLSVEGDESEAVRSTLASILWRWGERAEPWLVRQLEVPDRPSAHSAILALENSGSKAAGDALREIASSELAEGVTRYYADRAIAAIGARARQLV